MIVQLTLLIAALYGGHNILVWQTEPIDPPESMPSQIESMIQSNRAMYRRTRLILESSIGMFKQMEQNLGIDLPLEMRDRWQRDVREWQGELNKVKLFEIELDHFERDWKSSRNSSDRSDALERLERVRGDLWPPHALAPMPREVKR